jgi:hypothetical protein
MGEISGRIDMVFATNEDVMRMARENPLARTSNAVNADAATV